MKCTLNKIMKKDFIGPDFMPAGLYVSLIVLSWQWVSLCDCIENGYVCSFLTDCMCQEQLMDPRITGPLLC